MLELRPNCEFCDCDLLPNSTKAMICSYECTFCQDCVDMKLHDVCPNCGGGFTSRPVRPVKARRAGVSLIDQPASSARVHKKFTAEEIELFSQPIAGIPASER